MNIHHHRKYYYHHNLLSKRLKYRLHKLLCNFNLSMSSLILNYKKNYIHHHLKYSHHHIIHFNRLLSLNK